MRHVRASKSLSFTLLTGLVVCLAAWQSASGWNSVGHQVVAQIAYNHLDPEVKAKCDALIALPVVCGSSSHTFVSDSVWADQRCESWTSPQHYLDIPISLDGTSTNGVVYNPTNVVTAIRQYLAMLQDPSASTTNQAKALRYIIHFVGDIEQPLHCSTGVTASQTSGDGGGNSFSIGSGSLHSFWDGGGGYLPTGASVSSLANDVETLYPYSFSVGAIPDPMDWAVESWNISRTNTYVGITNGVSPSASYTAMTQAITKQRMAAGGQRLAKLLNTIFVTNAPPLISVTMPNGNFAFTWGSVSGRTYRVQSKAQPTDPAWSDVIDITAQSGSVTFTNPATQPQQYYRAIVVN